MKRRLIADAEFRSALIRRHFQEVLKSSSLFQEGVADWIAGGDAGESKRSLDSYTEYLSSVESVARETIEESEASFQRNILGEFVSTIIDSIVDEKTMYAFQLLEYAKKASEILEKIKLKEIRLPIIDSDDLEMNEKLVLSYLEKKASMLLDKGHPLLFFAWCDTQIHKNLCEEVLKFVGSQKSDNLHLLFCASSGLADVRTIYETPEEWVKLDIINPCDGLSDFMCAIDIVTSIHWEDKLVLAQKAFSKKDGRHILSKHQRGFAGSRNRGDRLF